MKIANQTTVRIIAVETLLENVTRERGLNFVHITTELIAKFAYKSVLCSDMHDKHHYKSV